MMPRKLSHVIRNWKSQSTQNKDLRRCGAEYALLCNILSGVNQVQATVRNQDIKKFQPILQGFLYFNLYARFKVIVRVIYDTRSTSLLLCDDLVFKLSDKQCVHLIRQHGENYDDYFPDELNVLVGKRSRCYHKMKLCNHVYQVKMLSQDEAMITMFKKDFIKEDPEVDPQTPVPSNANSSRFTNVDNIPFKINETPKSSYVASKGNASHGDGEHNSMSVESDAGGSGRKTNIH
ncbi:hypothetical protein Tco_0032699 [Tanacetum coccineum]